MNLTKHAIQTYEGANAYDLRGVEPLLHLVFNHASSLLTDSYYETEKQQIDALTDAIVDAYHAEARFPWQYAAWMRDPKNGKGNRIQGAIVPAILDGLAGEQPWTEEYVEKCLKFRPDDVITFFAAYRNLSLGRPSAGARRGMARALLHFDEYQLMKYARQRANVRLADVLALLRSELEELLPESRLALDVGLYLHAPTRDRDDHLHRLPLTASRRALFKRDVDYVETAAFADHVAQARVTWEQVFSKFGDAAAENDAKIARRNGRIWRALLSVPGLLGDMAFLRNARNLHRDGLSKGALVEQAKARKFEELWPHQVFAGYRAVPELRPVFDVAFARSAAKLPPGRHLGIADASGSMSVPVGGSFSSTRAVDIAVTFTALMSETSGLGASFADDAMQWGPKNGYLHMARRGARSPLEFAAEPALRLGMGGTQIFGAMMELISWLRVNRDVRPPDCLWFFSDMQFHPAGAKDDAPARKAIPKDLQRMALEFGIEKGAPPLEVAINLYRRAIGPVDCVLWNLAAHPQTPVRPDLPGVLFLSGFDAHSFRHVADWRERRASRKTVAARDKDVVIDAIRTY